MSACFGAVLKRLRLATAVSGHPRVGGFPARRHSHTLAATALSKLAGLDPAYVNLLEHHLRVPSRAIVEKLSTALACSETERALLLVSAGYWPWPDTDDARTEVLIGLCLAVLDGDYRPLHAPETDGLRAIHQQL